MRAAAGNRMKLPAGFAASAGDFVGANEAALRPVFASASEWDRFAQQVRDFSCGDGRAAPEAAANARD